MPSRNRVPNAAELVSRSLNCTRADSPCERSDMVNASRHYLPPPAQKRGGYDEQIIARSWTRVQPQDSLWFLMVSSRGRRAGADAQKKEPPFPAAFEVDNREASNRVDRSHSVSKEDDPSHKRE